MLSSGGKASDMAEAMELESQGETVLGQKRLVRDVEPTHGFSLLSPWRGKGTPAFVYIPRKRGDS